MPCCCSGVIKQIDPLIRDLPRNLQLSRRFLSAQRFREDVDLLDLLSRPNHIIPIYPHHIPNSNHHQPKAILKFEHLGRELQQISEERAVFFDP
jgi:hypothetical protein